MLKILKKKKGGLYVTVNIQFFSFLLHHYMKHTSIEMLINSWFGNQHCKVNEAKY